MIISFVFTFLTASFLIFSLLLMRSSLSSCISFFLPAAVAEDDDPDLLDYVDDERGGPKPIPCISCCVFNFLFLQIYSVLRNQSQD